MSVKKTKKVALKPHHSKSYRKRHYAFLITFVVGAVFLTSIILWYRESIAVGISGSRLFVSSLFKDKEIANPMVTVNSSYGTQFTFGSALFYGSAVTDDTNQLYVGSELATIRQYGTIRISPVVTIDEEAALTQSTFTLKIHPGYTSAKANLANVALADAGVSSKNLAQITTNVVNYGGIDFTRTVWEANSSDSLIKSIKTQFSTYTAKVNSSLVTIVIAHGATDAGQDTSYDSVLKSLTFKKSDHFASVSASTKTVASAPAGTTSPLKLLDWAMNSQTAFAATSNSTVAASEKSGALYSPAVVKIYNVYCLDLLVDGRAFISDDCSASSGSGFIISTDGYVGTNGHVATAKPLDRAIYNAVAASSLYNESSYLGTLLLETGLVPADITGKTAVEARSLIIDALYGLDESVVTSTNSIQNLVVSVTDTEPDTEKLIQATKNRVKFTTTDSSVHADLVDSNFRLLDGFDDKFKASDVALIKLTTGSNYPTVKLGSISNVIQGANLSIIGYPGQASGNGLVDVEKTTATLTSGKVSSIKNAAGSENKLIETDTTIGHGNSGGPVLNDDGLVVGIATYTSDGSGVGNGTYNYIRDIADFQKLVDKEGVTTTASETQVAWQEGIDKFYNSHYSSAVKSFAKVKELYPNHSRVAEFTTSAEARIANGDDVAEFPMWALWSGLGVLLAGAGVAVTLIVNHRKHHHIYNAGIAQGTVQPAFQVPFGPQSVTVTTVPPIVQAVDTFTPPVGIVAPAAPPVNYFAPTDTDTPAPTLATTEATPIVVTQQPTEPLNAPVQPNEPEVNQNNNQQ